MRYLETNSVTEIDKQLDLLYRRVMALEKATGIDMPRSAPRNPTAGMSWMDIEQGKIKVFNGSSWDEFSKD